MGQVKRVVVLSLSNFCLLLACLLFASGFFPYKPFIPGLASYDQLYRDRGVPPAPFDKVIFMVVDALRSDFVFSHESGFDFTQSLIKNGAAIPFTSHAAAPTVTMPRVKAITTGSIPSFLDMILNFAESDKSSSLATQDTWLAQMKSKDNGKLIMYGDDTWLKLFPDFFARADGTSSFFVSDFTEVDNNVTRHVPNELDNSDWNVMIMHYLGMDHIGHKGGPRSVNMLPKQREMDSIVKQIYNAVETKPHLASTLFIMCGDHGMNDNGNHGGSAPGETSPALVFMSPKFNELSDGYQCPTNETGDFEYYNLIEQSDIAATLAGLLGFPTPLNNLGVFMPQFLPMWTHVKHKEQILLGNALQMLNVVKVAYPHPIYDDPSVSPDCTGTISEAQSLACLWKTILDHLRSNEGEESSHSERLVASLSYFCNTIQSLLSSTASNYDETRLVRGLQFAIGITSTCFYMALHALKLPKSASGLYFMGMMVLYAIMMFASSYVEEEQQFWYWTASTWMTVQSFRLSPSFFALSLVAPLNSLALLRVLRRWNQSGQKWQGAADIAKLVELSPVALLWTPVLFTFQKVASEITTRAFEASGLSTFTSRFAAALLSIATFLLKIAHIYQHERWLLSGADYAVDWLYGLSCVTLAQLVFCWLLLSTTYVVAKRVMGRRDDQGESATLAEKLHPLLTLLLVVQTKAANIPVFLAFLYQVQILRRLPLSQAALTVTTITMAHASFFALGNTNAISSIDLSNAYNGITSYNPVPVGILLFIGNWAGPIFWSFSGLVLVLRKSREQSQRQTTVKSPNQTRKWKQTRKETTLPGTGHSANTESTRELAVNPKNKTDHPTPKSQTSPKSPQTSQQKNPTDLETNASQLSTRSKTQQSPAVPKKGKSTTAAPQKSVRSSQIQSSRQKQSKADRDIERNLVVDAWLSHAEMLTLWTGVEITFVLCACAVLKEHLFIWTVFSPKFLYVAAWFVGWHICCNLILGGVLAFIQ